MRTSIAVPFLLFVSSVGGVALAHGAGGAAARPAAARERPMMERVNPAHREAAAAGAERAPAFRAERPASMVQKGASAERPMFSAHQLRPQVVAAAAKAAPVIHLESTGGPKTGGGGQQGTGHGGSGQGSGQGTTTQSPSHTEHQVACQPGSPNCGANRSEGRPPSTAKARVYSEEEARAVVQFAGTTAVKASERGKEILKAFMKKAMCARVGGDACG